jgi:hypothetical protein
VRRQAAKRSLTATLAAVGSKTTVAAARHIEPATGLPASMRSRPVDVCSDAVTG